VLRRVGDVEEATGSVHGNPGGSAQHAARIDPTDRSPVSGEDADDASHSVGHVDSPRRIGVDPEGKTEGALTPRRDFLIAPTLAVEHEQRVPAGVGHEQPPRGVEADAERRLELLWSPLSEERCGEAAPEARHDDVSIAPELAAVDEPGSLGCGRVGDGGGSGAPRRCAREEKHEGPDAARKAAHWDSGRKWALKVRVKSNARVYSEVPDGIARP
jgi:hypothetical protein